MLNTRDLTLRVKRKTIFPIWKVDLDLNEGEHVAVVGESGGGKTSLAWSLMGHPLPGQQLVGGTIRFRGTDLLTLAPSERARLYYRELALVPQNAQNIFHPTQQLWKSAREVIFKDPPGKLRMRDVCNLVTAFSQSLELPASLWSHYPHQLSGGQKQRMALILALLNSPRLLLLDEPSNALDELNRKILISFLRDWASSRRATLLIFTHDIGIAASWAERIVVLYRGEIVEELPAARIQHPYHPYTQGLIAANIRLGDLPLSRHSIPGSTIPISDVPSGCGFFERCPRARKYCQKENPRLHQWGESRVRCFDVH